eukprot:2416777-Prorocentrum_lima.AAC.1
MCVCPCRVVRRRPSTTNVGGAPSQKETVCHSGASHCMGKRVLNQGAVQDVASSFIFCPKMLTNIPYATRA